MAERHHASELEMPCESCRKPVGLCWFAENSLWNRLARDKGISLLCPACFDRMCREENEPVVWCADLAGNHPREQLAGTQASLAQERELLADIRHAWAAAEKEAAELIRQRDELVEAARGLIYALDLPSELGNIRAISYEGTKLRDVHKALSRTRASIQHNPAASEGE